jgi:hypothetical protein
LGGTLYSKYSTIRTLQIRSSTADSKYVFESSTINSYSEHPSQIFEKFYENETNDNFHGTSEQEQTAIIWLSDVSDYTEREKYTFNLFGMSNTSGHTLKYRIVIGHGAYKAADVDDVTQFIIEDYEILGTLGKALFPSICKGLFYTSCLSLKPPNSSNYSIINIFALYRYVIFTVITSIK